jgi:hypothetical protein
MSFRSAKLLRAAKDQRCVICCSTSGVVACHANSVAMGKGKGIKAPDYFTAWLCKSCHDMADGRKPLAGAFGTPIEFWLWAYWKTVEQWFRQEIVVVK